MLLQALSGERLFLENIHEALTTPDFPPTKNRSQARAELDAPRRGNRRRGRAVRVRIDSARCHAASSDSLLESKNRLVPLAIRAADKRVDS